MGPRARKGKKVRTTSIKTLPTRTTENVKVSVLRPTSGLRFLPIIEPARARRIPIGAYRPTKITIAVEMLKNRVFPETPRKSDPLFEALVVNS